MTHKAEFLKTLGERSHTVAHTAPLWGVLVANRRLFLVRKGGKGTERNARCARRVPILQRSLAAVVGGGPLVAYARFLGL